MASSKNSRRSLALPVLALIAAGCGAGRVPDDELVVLLEQPPVSIDPRYCLQASDFKVSRMVYAPLVSTDTQTLEAKMELAESVRSVGNDWEITLRDAQFSDGKPVTTDDVVYTMEAMLDPSCGGGPCARMRRTLKEAGFQRFDVKDAKHMTARLSHPHAPFGTDLNMGLMERPPPGTSKDALPRGAGAYTFEARHGETWILARNVHYVGGAPPMARLIFKTIRDDNSRLLALVGGSGDLTQNTISQLLVDAVAEQPRLAVETAPSSVYSYLLLNDDDPILKDVRVRQAIAYAVDRKTIIDTKLHGRAQAATGMLPTFHWAYEKDVKDYPFDPEQAKRLLDEAGYRDPDGDGPEPRFTIIYKTSSNKVRVAIANVIASMLRQVGIGVDLRVYEFATLFADLKKGNFQMSLLQIPEISEPDLYINFFDSARVPTRDNLDAGGNRERYRNAEVDRLIAEGRHKLDRPGRKRVYSQIQKILARDVPVVSLWHEYNVVARRKNVEGFVMLPTAQLSGLDKVYKTKAR
ncbi:MAG TPA: ABC transporter substrate-binding protein [Polyangia bacterium]